MPQAGGIPGSTSIRVSWVGVSDAWPTLQKERLAEERSLVGKQKGRSWLRDSGTNIYLCLILSADDGGAI